MPHDIADLGYCTTANFHVDEKMKGNDDIGLESMITDANFFVEALFDSLAQGGPENGTGDGTSFQGQPNLDDLMDLDPMAPLQAGQRNHMDWLSSSLPDSTGPLRRAHTTEDIKDIQVQDTSSLHPFSHASQAEFYNKGSNRGSSGNSRTGAGDRGDWRQERNKASTLAGRSSSMEERGGSLDGRGGSLGGEGRQEASWPGKQEVWGGGQSAQVALRGSVIQGGGGGEVESRSSVIQSSQVVRPTHIVPRPATHQQVVMTSSQASTFVNQQQGNDFTSSRHSLGQQAERLGREGLRPSLAGSRQLV